MIIRKTYRYLCDHCKKGFWKTRDCLEHEIKCFSNPLNKACKSCGNFTQEEGIWFCLNYDMDLYSNIDSLDEGQVGMKLRRQCVSWKNKDIK